MRILGVLKGKYPFKVLKMGFNGAIVNEASVEAATSISQGPSINITGDKLNLNGGAGSHVSVTQTGVWSSAYTLQRDLDITFDLVLSSSSPDERIVLMFADATQNNLFAFYYLSGGLFRLYKTGGGFQFLDSTIAMPRDVSYPCRIEYRKTSAKFFINGFLRIDATGWTPPANIARTLRVGGTPAGDAILGSIDNLEITVL